MSPFRWASWLVVVVNLFIASSCTNGDVKSLATTRICQLTGVQDRSVPGTHTGMELGGITGGVTGTDIGWPFEHDGRVYFLFGDTRNFSPDLCEPYPCGVVNVPPGPKPVLPQINRVQRWFDDTTRNSWLAEYGDGSESMASARPDFDPDNCIPLTVETEIHAGIFAHAVSSTAVGTAIKLSAAPVAANPQDRFVVAMGSRILVVTDDRKVFVHGVFDGVVDFGYQLNGVLRPEKPGDRVLVLENRLLVVAADGRVFARTVNFNDNTIAGEVELQAPPGQPPVRVAARPEDKWVVTHGNQILVITNRGQVFAHTINGNTLEPAFLMSNPGPPVAANPQDKYVLVSGDKILVITDLGDLFKHELTSTGIGPFRPLPGAQLATGAHDKWVVAVGERIFVLTREDAFRPTRLDGRRLGRQEGAFTGFSDGRSMFAFFTQKAWPFGCDDPDGCAHDHKQAGGKAILASSRNRRGRFDQMTFFSANKFIFPAPVIAQGSVARGLPTDLMGQQVAFIFGAGRETNSGPSPDQWNHSYPYLAVHSLGDVAARSGTVYAHPITSSRIGDAIQIGEAVGSRPEDKWVLLQDASAGRRILVIREDGGVFSHPLGDSVGTPVGVPPAPGSRALVATNPRDKWVLAHKDRILVITEEGHVFAHRVTSQVEPAFELGGPDGRPAPPVAANPVDRWVLVSDDRILVITSQGKVFAHDVTDTTVRPAIELMTPAGGVAGNPRDRWVLAMGDKIVVIRGNGEVVTHLVRRDRIEGAVAVQSTQRVAANPEDRWVLGAGSVDVNGKLIVIPYKPAGWRYFAGLQNGVPRWEADEALARPLLPFGSFDSDPTDSRYQFHKCLGYFSVRFIESVQKWVMLYTCTASRDNTWPRGIYMRSATIPWGPWSTPARIFDPDDGYCRFMYRPQGCTSGTNPFEEEKRSLQFDPVTKSAVIRVLPMPRTTLNVSSASWRLEYGGACRLNRWF